MGQSATATIAYGYVVDSYEQDLPWKEADLDLVDWWRKENGFEDLPGVYTAEGNYFPGMKGNQAAIDAFFKHRKEWDKENPIPVEVIEHYEFGCGPLILAIPNSPGLRASWDDIEEINSDDFVLNTGYDEDVQKLETFMADYGIEPTKGPGFYLMCDHG